MTENKKPDSSKTVTENLTRVSDLLKAGRIDNSEKVFNTRDALIYNTSEGYNPSVQYDLVKNVGESFKGIVSDIHHKTTYANFDLVPDIGGYFIAFHVPGTWVNNLSWLNSKEAAAYKKTVINFNKSFPTLCTSITIPSVQVSTEQISSKSKTTSIAVRLDRGSEMSISYIERRDLVVGRFHSIWGEYMEGSRRGVPYHMETPKNKIKRIGNITFRGDDEFYDLDYAGAFWVCKFASMTVRPLFIGKMLGVIPTSIPQNEFIGSRGQHDVTKYTISYQIADYYFKYLDYEDDQLKNLNSFDNKFVNQFIKDYNTYVIGNGI